MVCAQYADWIPSSFNSSENIENAFIVQEINFENVIDDKKDSLHYYEAWHVMKGICKKDPVQESHDLFCVGHPLDSRDALKYSIGHKGRVSFFPRVFFIGEDSPLYCEIHSWKTNVVSLANGLHSFYYAEDIGEKMKEYQEYYRKPFCHEWDFTDVEKIYRNVFRYCNTLFHQDNKIDIANFYIAIDDLFPEGVYSEIKRRVVKSWECNEVIT